MSIGSVFVNNRTQAVRLPADTRFPESVKKVNVRVIGRDRVLSLADGTWDSFFLSEDRVTEDFMQERASQGRPIARHFDVEVHAGYQHRHLWYQAATH